MKLPGPFPTLLWGAVALWTGFWLLTALLMPALPVDETRYLTVAWEMRQAGEWFLLSMNGAPYSHKPPLLFWLINLVWSVGGTEIGVARLVPLLATLTVLGFTYALGRAFYPDKKNVALYAALMLMAMPPFMIYGTLIMFDFLLAACVAGGMLALWRAFATQDLHCWLLFGLAMGLGALAKGPVILFHLMPAALLLPLAARSLGHPLRLARWYAGALLALAIAFAIGLAWAVPAALKGGPEFAHMLFWGQSAGRMVKAFDHAEPWWFYLPFLLVFVLPFLFWAPFWRSLSGARAADPALRLRLGFLACWVLPPLLLFTLTSGKQVHYLTPLLPGFALALALLLARYEERQDAPARRFAFLLPAVAVLALFIAGPHLPFIRDSSDRVLREIFTAMPAWLPPLAILACCALILRWGRTLAGQLFSMVAAMTIVMSVFVTGATHKAFHHYDLRPLAAALQPYKDGPLAYTPRYEAELGYLARMDKPFTVLAHQELSSWLRANPGGMAVVRYRPHEDVSHLNIVFSIPYRADQFIAIVKP